jgi:hypothetical protein
VGVQEIGGEECSDKLNDRFSSKNSNLSKYNNCIEMIFLVLISLLSVRDVPYFYQVVYNSSALIFSSDKISHNLFILV